MLARLHGDLQGPLGIEMLAMAVNGDQSCSPGIAMVHYLLAEMEAWS